MKRLRFVQLLVASLAFVCSGLRAAESAPATPAKSSLVGEFAGRWRAQNDTSGDVRFKFTQVKDGAWAAEMTFTFDGNEVPTKTTSFKVEGDKFELVASWDVQGTSASSKIKGTLSGDQLEGSYESTASEREAAGTWKATRRAAKP